MAHPPMKNIDRLCAHFRHLIWLRVGGQVAVFPRRDGISLTVLLEHGGRVVGCDMAADRAFESMTHEFLDHISRLLVTELLRSMSRDGASAYSAAHLPVTTRLPRPQES